MVSAVIFDFYGTLAHFADAGAPDYETLYQAIFAAHGYALEKTALDDYYSRYDGVEHGEHSISEAAYETWVRSRLRDLTDACGVRDQHVEDLLDALRDVDQGEMVPYPEAVATLSSLRDAGLAIGVCSNWGWELDAFLEQAGLLELVDAGVTSARAGSRKPHPDIYDVSVAALGVETAEVVFVGDSWELSWPWSSSSSAASVGTTSSRRSQACAKAKIVASAPAVVKAARHPSPNHASPARSTGTARSPAFAASDKRAIVRTRSAGRDSTSSPSATASEHPLAGP